VLLSLELSNSVERDAFIFFYSAFIHDIFFIPFRKMIFSSCPSVGFILFAFCICLPFHLLYAVNICFFFVAKTKYHCPSKEKKS